MLEESVSQSCNSAFEFGLYRLLMNIFLKGTGLNIFSIKSMIAYTQIVKIKYYV